MSTSNKQMQGIKGESNKRATSKQRKQQSSQHIKQVYHIKHNKPQHTQNNNQKSNEKNTLRMKEKYLKIPVDYNSSSLTDFRGLMAKQRSLLSDDSNDTNTINDNTLFSRFKQLIGPKQQQYYNNSYNNNNDVMIDNINKLSILHESEKKSDDSYDIDTQSVTTISSKMENNKPSSDYIRRFWMSDKNCSQCSECGATFHTFRRKHHCRLCGRVFCQTCCSERININKFKKLKNQYTYKDNEEENNNNNNNSNNINNTGGMMRVCVFCSKLQTSDR
eukprot:485721_1